MCNVQVAVMAVMTCLDNHRVIDAPTPTTESLKGSEPELVAHQCCSRSQGFFRRSIQQKIQYRPCTKNQQCSILRINRNRCQYCRLKKCIAVGMSRDGELFFLLHHSLHELPSAFHRLHPVLSALFHSYYLYPINELFSDSFEN